ncbi:hypothetical protein GGI26_001621 [Coemansia sp. RSA 1358]|nr:hypothetical protein GGI26_001621 [Coemansia sp. RSA 1358]
MPPELVLEEVDVEDDEVDELLLDFVLDFDADELYDDDNELYDDDNELYTDDNEPGMSRVGAVGVTVGATMLVPLPAPIFENHPQMPPELVLEEVEVEVEVEAREEGEGFGVDIGAGTAAIAVGPAVITPFTIPKFENHPQMPPALVLEEVKVEDGEDAGSEVDEVEDEEDELEIALANAEGK